MIIPVLFLGAGRKVSLLEEFIRSSKELNINLKLYSYEKDNYQPVSLISEILIGKNWTDPSVDDNLLDIINQKKIKLIISCVDPAILIQSRIKKIHSSASFCSEDVSVKICNSKKIFQNFCIKNQLPVIPQPNKFEFPKIIKPDSGSSSIGIKKVNNILEELMVKKLSQFLTQKFIDGIEYTVDSYVSRDLTKKFFSPRIRLKTVGGEVVSTKTFIDEEVIELSKKVSEILGLVGPFNIQFIREFGTKKLFLLEINLRFGGGVIASINSGFDFPKAILCELLGLQAPIMSLRSQLKMIRYYKEVFYEIGY